MTRSLTALWLLLFLGACAAMPKSVPMNPNPLSIEQIGQMAESDVRSRQRVPLEIWQSMPTFLRKPEYAKYPLIAYTYHVTFKRPVGYHPSEPMWVNYIDPFTGEIILSDYPDRPYFPDDPTTGVFLGRKYEGMAVQGSVEKPLFKPIDEPVWKAGFNRLLKDSAVLSNPAFFDAVPAQPSSEDIAFAFAYWRQNDTSLITLALNKKMFYWGQNLLYDHHPKFPGAISDPYTGKPLVKWQRSPAPPAVVAP
ncbi:hypothetical protein ACFSM5_15595 [Lacibacterium aquatile]|uniref:Lipoprotein n=1 Tax=Lacibacterium aquatile TaxID=1168082 RepID=A0ABW5DTB0_9PROT